MNWIRVFSPATIGNIGPGFDTLGMAIKDLGDVIEARKIESGIVITAIDSSDNISYCPDKNTAGIAALEVLKMLKLEEEIGIEIRIRKGMPVGSGLGSSAASAAAAAYATNYLCGNKLSKEDLIFPATKAEEYVSGGFFADNTSAAMLGGVVISRSKLPIDVVKLGTMPELKIIIVIPKLVILTKKAREILPDKIKLNDFILNMCNSCLITAAFAQRNYDLLVKGLNDIVIEPVRATLIPGFKIVKKSAMQAGADGVAISGSGPTIFSITNNENKIEKIRKAMVNAFNELNIECKSFVTEIDNEGTRII